MKRVSSFSTCHLLPLLLIIYISPSFVTASNVHIVHMGRRKHHDPSIIMDSHHDMLAKLLGSKDAAKDSLVYSYRHSFSGFAAKVTKSQAKLLAEFPGVVSVMPNRIHRIQTTRSWDFLKLNPSTPGNLISHNNMGDGVIIGIIDSGIWPESESFSDKNMSNVPSHWKGVCEEGESFNSSNCNKKIIGARWFAQGLQMEKTKMLKSKETHDEYMSPRDSDGHGTHTASIAAGSFVEEANFLGLAPGLARGGAPRACLAIYKVCWAPEGHCSTADILAAFDHAIADGVDVLSVSLGTSPPFDSYADDGIAVGAFHAVARGITVVAAAGNSGPFTQTVENTAPWIISVAASTIDRSYPTTITLGNNKTVVGQAFNRLKFKKGFRGIVYSEDIANETSSSSSFGCNIGSLNATLAKGNVVLCFLSYDQHDMHTASLSVGKVGGIGVIFAQYPSNLLFSCGSIPCIQVDFEIGTQILLYMRSARSPIVKFSLSKTCLGLGPSPKVASFSSRGPSSLSPAVLKPDIAAPGATILAAWPHVLRAVESEPISTNFNIMSGTSMSTPHVSGIVALIKLLHPNWSPSAINSALVTTASTEDEYGRVILAEGGPRKPATPFEYGGGHVNPNRAADPGLVYDMRISDHVQFLCSMGYNKSAISHLTKESTSCAYNHHPSSVLNLNLPSIAIPNLKSTVTITRTVTNVGPVNSIYSAIVESPPGVRVLVKPRVLEFNATVSVVSYELSFWTSERIQGDYSFGSLSWSDGVHIVRSPIAIRKVMFDSYSDF